MVSVSVDAFRRLEGETAVLYERREYAEALALVDELEPQLDELGHRTKAAFYRACLLARVGDVERALEVLEAGRETGLWWSARMLSDPDLDPCRGARLDAIVAAADSVVPSDPACLLTGSAQASRPLLVGLHGGGEVVTKADNPWAVAERRGWRLARPVSSQRQGAGLATWTDLDRAVTEFGDHIARWRPSAVGAKSLGGSLALRLAAEGLDAPILLAAPSIRTEVLETVLSSRLPPIHIITGAADPYLASTQTAVAALREAGATVDIDIRDGVAHDFPPDFDIWLSTRLDHIVAP
jgi:hypothetical protein